MKIEEIYTPSMNSSVSEQFKGEVEKVDIKFPNELGEEHPFDFRMMEELNKKCGLYNAILDKYVDFIWGAGFYVTCKEDRAKTIVEDFIKDVDLATIGRTWTKEGLSKGNGFLEIGGSEAEGVKGLKVLNANHMYVQRDKLGVVLGYNQYVGGFTKGFNYNRMIGEKKIILFTPEQIAHLSLNVIGDCAYGYGIGYPNMSDINNLLQQEKDVHQIYKRKANSPLHAKLGMVQGDIKIIPKPEDVAAFGQKMETMDNKTEWATDSLVEFKVIDFGNIGDKFSAILDYDILKLLYGFQIPPELMGLANIPEGLGRVRMEGLQKRIQSFQAVIEKVLEQQIFKRVLQANGLEVDIEFEWGTPSILEIEGRIKTIIDLIKSMTTSPALRMMLEDEMVNLLKLDEDEWEQKKLEQEQKDEEERKRLEAGAVPIVPGQNKSFPQKILPKTELPKQPKPTPKVNQNYEYAKECKHTQESWDNLDGIEEWLGFKYQDYLAFILNNLKTYDFDLLKATTEAEVAAGYLSQSQIDELKGILENGFKKGLGMREIAKQVDAKLGLKDLYRINEEGELKRGVSGLPILAKTKENRAIGIVRSEITRLANQGAVDYYKESGVNKVRWVASFGARTCPDCEALNGTIYDIGAEEEMPFHPMCRCTYAPVVELK